MNIIGTFSFKLLLLSVMNQLSQKLEIQNCRYKSALGGLWVVSVLFACYTSTEALRVSSSTWLSVWTAQDSTTASEAGYFLFIYALFSFGQVILQ